MASEADLNDIISHLFDRSLLLRYHLIPDYHSSIQHLVEQRFPEKLKISTLQEVFFSFCNVWRFDTDTTKVPSVVFSYGGQKWKGTISRDPVRYEEKDVTYLNIRLPNDGYFYQPSYENNNALVDTNETQEFVDGIIEALKSGGVLQHVCDFELIYDSSTQQVRLQFWESETFCVAVNFHNGYHERAAVQRVNEFASLLAKHAPKQK